MRRSFFEDREELTSQVRILIFLGKEILPVSVCDILFAYADNKYRFVCTREAIYQVNETLDELEMILGVRFFRINRQFVVSLKIIDKILLEENSKLKIELKDPFDHILTISRRRAYGFRKWLELADI